MDYLRDIVVGFKNVFNIADDDLDAEDQEILQGDIQKYVEIVSSSKYADSNSDTNAMEKILYAIKKAENIQDENKHPETTGEAKDKISIQDTKDPTCQETKPIVLEEIAFGKKGFRDRLLKHRQLVDELENQSAFLPGQPVYQSGSFGNNFSLPFYKVPRKVYDFLESADKNILNLQSALSKSSYVDKFQKLLWIEEAHQAIEMHRYNLYNQMIAKLEKGFFLLKVPGLAEGRPSLIRGDRLLLKSEARSSNYEGYIHDVREKDIIFKLHSSVTSLDGLTFDVIFISNRTAFRRCHHGVQNFHRLKVIQDIIFPVKLERETTDLIPIKDNKDKELRCFMKQLNIAQKRAVTNILKARCRPAPYIVFGPPGTGKTVTIVEAILQVYAREPSSFILVCGNSNSCADLIAERIKFSGVLREMRHMVRLSAFYRMEKLIPEDIKDITIDSDTLPSVINELKIIVTTCIQSGTLYNYQTKFDYVFIDEAGHANEPESLISIGLVDTLNGCVVLAGDFKQLGPVVISEKAKYNGLGTSLLERISKRPIYQKALIGNKNCYNEKYLTKLVVSYRSDPRVLQVSNELFYDNELKFVIKSPKKWLNVLNFPQPLVYHPIRGRERREYTNPSWFNPNEAIKVILYVKRLYDAGLRPEQLGIITPYRGQINKLYMLFDRVQLDYCKIATMEEFQGDEREIIIISTVRTRSKNVELDKKFSLGFLFDDKRFNVAVTRAKWICLVVGDPQILKKDPCWVKFMQTAHKVSDKHSTASDNSIQRCN